MKLSYAMALLAVALMAALQATTVAACGINIRNQCPYKVTTCAQSGNKPISQYNLAPGGSQFLDFGSACQWPAGTIWPSTTGQCIAPGQGNPAASSDRNRANLAEFTIGSGGPNGKDFYDVSNVNAYTIGLMINPTSIARGLTRSGYQCGTPSCTISNIQAFCKQTNVNVYSKAATGAETCFNTDGPGRNPTANTRFFKNACAKAYSYSLDDPTSTYTCSTGSNYEVVFCP